MAYKLFLVGCFVGLITIYFHLVGMVGTLNKALFIVSMAIIGLLMLVLVMLFHIESHKYDSNNGADDQ